eukprot:5699097-Pyramimonas_sp.AAC.1
MEDEGPPVADRVEVVRVVADLRVDRDGACALLPYTSSSASYLLPPRPTPILYLSRPTPPTSYHVLLKLHASSDSSDLVLPPTSSSSSISYIRPSTSSYLLPPPTSYPPDMVAFVILFVRDRVLDLATVHGLDRVLDLAPVHGLGRVD